MGTVLLQRLREYSERLNLPPALYAEVPIRYVIDLRADGSFEAISDTADPGSPAARRGVRRLAPQVKRSSGIKPLLLADNAEYTFGLPRSGGNEGRVRQAHEAYVELLDECLRAFGSAEVQAVLWFIQAPGWDESTFPEDFDRGATITFRVDGTFVMDLPGVRAFWAAVNAPVGAPVMQCLICGEQRPVMERLQGAIKGIPGGQTSGTSIISANAGAFESYGLSASLTAPTCSDCGERFTKALNHLLSDDYSRIRFGDSVYVFWTRQPDERNFFQLLDEASPDEVKRFIESVRSGGRTHPGDPNRFYAVALSAAGGRAVVREWIDATLPEVEQAFATWFGRHVVVDASTGERRYFGLRALAGATARELKDIPAPTTRALLRSAVTGAPLPWDLMAAALRRAVADRSVTASQAGLIKAVLASSEEGQEEIDMTGLAPDHGNVGYHCGRLLAVLDSIQRAAIPGVKAGIVDRYFGSAASSPASVFGRLVQGAQPHLARLERDRPAVQVALQRRMEEVLEHIPSFPRVLRLQDQGYFALGYYHQRADDRARARAAAERRRVGTASAVDEGDAELGEAVED